MAELGMRARRPRSQRGGTEIRLNGGNHSLSIERIISHHRWNGLIRAAQGTRGGGQVKQISIFVLGFAAAFASGSAPAQDLTAGKTPAQLFRSDCAECH